MKWAEGISEGVPMGPTSHLGAPGGGVARPGTSWAPGAPPGMILVPKILKYYIKIHVKILLHSEHFYFWAIFLLHG